MQWYLRSLREKGGKEIPLTYHEIFETPPLFFTCRSRELIERYRAGMEKIRASGQLDSIKARYLK